jgi:hypothetical protein
MAPHRLNRTEAYAKRWGDEAYALEELTVEISAAILCAELGIADHVTPAQREKHLANHAGYLQSWLKVLSRTRSPSSPLPRPQSASANTHWDLSGKRRQFRSTKNGWPNTTQGPPVNAGPHSVRALNYRHSATLEALATSLSSTPVPAIRL